MIGSLITYMNRNTYSQSTAFEHLRQYHQDPPFNDLWPPTYFPRCPLNRFARQIWYTWLLEGWIHDRPYRDLHILDYSPIYQHDTHARRISTRRRNKLLARKRYVTTPRTKLINTYSLRNRNIKVIVTDHIETWQK